MPRNVLPRGTTAGFWPSALWRISLLHKQPKPAKLEATLLDMPNTTWLHATAHKLTSWVGSPASLISHTVFFAGTLILALFGIDLGKLLLVLTTIVSLEAIYLSIFIQYSVNQHAKTLTEVAEDIEDVTVDVEGISENVDELSAEMEDISENLEEMQTETANEEIATYERLEQQLHTLLDEVKHLRERAPQSVPPTTNQTTS